jgi:ubiquinone biosynthesis protein COQ9
VSAIWYAAGDTATDFNYYTKRALLAGVYSATVLYWLDDKSEDFAKTWTFLDRRIADVMRVPQVLGALRERLGGILPRFRPFTPR